MKIYGNYQDDGYAHLKGLIAPDVTQAFLQALKQDIGDDAIPLSGVTDYPNLLHRPAFEMYGHHYKPMLFFLWGLTPIIADIVGKDLVPTYDYLRIYREGDLCRIHSDRQSCEHSLSLTLDYSDGVVWPLEVGKERLSAPSSRIDDDWQDESYHSIGMEVGDAILYQGVHHRHGRMTRNPNEWSVHLFLHWVDRQGHYADFAFDGRIDPKPIDFRFI